MFPSKEQNAGLVVSERPRPAGRVLQRLDDTVVALACRIAEPVAEVPQKIGQMTLEHLCDLDHRPKAT